MKHPVLLYRPIIPGKPGKDDIPLPGLLTDEQPESSDGTLVVVTSAGKIHADDIAGLVVDVQFSNEAAELLNKRGDRTAEDAMKIADAVDERLAVRRMAREKGWEAY